MTVTGSTNRSTVTPISGSDTRRGWIPLGITKGALARRELLVLGALLGATVWLHLGVAGPVPSGPDGGNWLAMAQERFLGRDVMAAAVTYPPLLPLSVAGLLLVFDPITAIATMAILAKSLVVVATYVCARSMGRTYAAVAALLVGVAGAQLEAYSWAHIHSCWGRLSGWSRFSSQSDSRASGSTRQMWTAVVLALLAYSTHTLIGGLLVFVFPLAVAYGLWLIRAGRASWKRGLWTALALSLPGGLLAAYNLVINPQEGVRYRSSIRSRCHGRSRSVTPFQKHPSHG